MALQGEYIDTDIECRTLFPRAKETVKENPVRLYPNPGTGIFYLELPDDHDISTINISSAMRKNILTIPANRQSTILLDLNGYKSGIYYYECLSDDRPVYSGKFILINP